MVRFHIGTYSNLDVAMWKQNQDRTEPLTFDEQQLSAATPQLLFLQNASNAIACHGRFANLSNMRNWVTSLA